MSAAQIASSPLVVLKEPATARPMARDSLSNRSKGHAWPSQIASIPYAAVLSTPSAFVTVAKVRIRYCPSARWCFTRACQLSQRSIEMPNHRTNLALISNFRTIPRQPNSQSFAFSSEGLWVLYSAKIHATSVFPLSNSKQCFSNTSWTLSRSSEACSRKSSCEVRLMTQEQSSRYEAPVGTPGSRRTFANVRVKRMGGAGRSLGDPATDVHSACHLSVYSGLN
jgi:hypothetical protein